MSAISVGAYVSRVFREPAAPGAPVEHTRRGVVVNLTEAGGAEVAWDLQLPGDGLGGSSYLVAETLTLLADRPTVDADQLHGAISLALKSRRLAGKWLEAAEALEVERPEHWLVAAYADVRAFLARAASPSGARAVAWL